MIFVLIERSSLSVSLFNVDKKTSYLQKYLFNLFNEIWKKAKREREELITMIDGFVFDERFLKKWNTQKMNENHINFSRGQF